MRIEMNRVGGLSAVAIFLGIAFSTAALAEDAAPPKELTNKSGIKLCLIPAGEFMMGSPKEELGHNAGTESPQHKVRITKPFYIAATEITQGEWTKVMGSTFDDLSDKNWKNRPPVGPDLPMYWVSWFDALSFCNKLSEKAGRKPYYKLTNIAMENYGNGAIDKADLEILGGNGYRLPSEAQWEYASAPDDDFLGQRQGHHLGRQDLCQPRRDRLVRRQLGQGQADQTGRQEKAQRLGRLRHARQHDGMVRGRVRREVLREVAGRRSA